MNHKKRSYLFIASALLCSLTVPSFGVDDPNRDLEQLTPTLSKKRKRRTENPIVSISKKKKQKRENKNFPLTESLMDSNNKCVVVAPVFPKQSISGVFPNEILQEIMKYLPAPDLFSMSCSSRTMKGLVIEFLDLSSAQNQKIAPFYKQGMLLPKEVKNIDKIFNNSKNNYLKSDRSKKEIVDYLIWVKNLSKTESLPTALMGDILFEKKLWELYQIAEQQELSVSYLKNRAKTTEKNIALPMRRFDQRYLEAIKVGENLKQYKPLLLRKAEEAEFVRKIRKENMEFFIDAILKLSIAHFNSGEDNQITYDCKSLSDSYRRGKTKIASIEQFLALPTITHHQIDIAYVFSYITGFISFPTPIKSNWSNHDIISVINYRHTPIIFNYKNGDQAIDQAKTKNFKPLPETTPQINLDSNLSTESNNDAITDTSTQFTIDPTYHSGYFMNLLDSIDFSWNSLPPSINTSSSTNTIPFSIYSQDEMLKPDFNGEFDQL